MVEAMKRSRAIKRSHWLAAALATLGALIGWGAFWYTAAAPQEEVVSRPPVSILFAGDIMLDRDSARAAQARGPQYLFGSSSELFEQSPLRVANLEGTITGNPSIAQRDSSILRFTFEPSLAREVIEGLNLSAVSLANNHSLDFGAQGFNLTRDYLSQWGVASFGSPYNASSTNSTILTSGGISVCLVGYMELFDPDEHSAINAIESLRPSCSRIIVFAHWGVEYSHAATTLQVREAHDFIDAGADAVVGAHPHVVEPVEVYRGKPIVYSLGNFIFDQNFSWDVEHGALLKVDLYPDHLRLTLIPTTIEDEHSSLAQGADYERVLSLMGLPEGIDTLSLP